MKATIIEMDADMLVLRPANDPSNVVMVYRDGPDDPNFEHQVGETVELENS